MVYIASFVLFLLFARAMELGLILNKRPLKTEDEATAAILQSMSCASCNSTLCGYAGKSGHKPKADCKGPEVIPHKSV